MNLDSLLKWSKNKNLNPLTGQEIKMNKNMYIKMEKYHKLLNNNTFSFYSKGPKGEDRIVLQKDHHHLFAGVYDGHGGSLTSEYIKQNIILFYANIQINSIPKRLYLTYQRLETELFNYYKTFNNKDYSGSTACSVIITDDYIFVANTGDSRCILSEEKRAIALTCDHKPSENIEYKRITENKENITFSGVYRIGGLAVSRVFGDFYIKYKYKSVIFNPDIYAIKRIKTYDFLVIASDGLYDVMTNQEIVDFIYNQFKTMLDLNKIVKNLVEYSINIKKSTDDVSIIIVLL